MTDEQQRLAADNVKLAYRVAWSWHRQGARLDVGDLIGAGMLGLVYAARTYRPDVIGKGGTPVTFSTWATRCIINAIIGAEKAERRHASCSLDVEDREIDPADGRDDFERADARLTAPELLGIVDERKAGILMARAEGFTLQEIADRDGVSRERIRVLEKTAIEMIRETVSVE
ncbi:MAG TPA: sigma-70 family RNA polymerase sigma factor [Gemmataceae bacterium]|nr:sigma-70 family RNA polymerase sigma factor [Gemmataceae bacterium]